MIGLVLGATMALVPAHPLGNFSVNQLVSLNLHPDRVEAVAVVDLAELPSLQLKPTCAEISSRLAVHVAGERLNWTIVSSDLARQPGAAGLDTTRVTCQLSAPATLHRPASVEIANDYLPERLGWHEITATGAGVQVTGLAPVSVTDQLRSYPDDLLSSPPDMRFARLSVQPGTSPEAAVARVAAGQPGFFARAEAWLQDAAGDRTLTPLVGLLAALLAIVLGAGHALLPGHGKTVMAVYLAGRAGRARDALLVGATVTATHTGGVLALGLLLTGASSLAGESVLGWLGIASGALVSAVGVTMLAAALRHRRHHASGHGSRSHHHAPHHHGPHHHAPHHHGPHHHAAHHHAPQHHGRHHEAGVQEWGHRHGPLGHTHDREQKHHLGAAGHGQTHDREQKHHLGAAGHGHTHDGDETRGHPAGEGSHTIDPREKSHHGAGEQVHGDNGGRRGRRLGLAAIGVAGGLVPSPSALIVLLGAIALGRTGFGILLVLAYGLGMAATLTVAGLTLLKVRDRLRGRLRMLTRLAPAAPFATGGLVLVVGCGLAARAAALVV